MKRPSVIAFGVAQEAGVRAGITQRQGLAVDPNRAVLQGTHEVISGVLQGVQVAVVFPAVQVGDGDEGFEGAVSRAGTVPGQRGIHSGNSLLDSDNGVGDR